MNGRIDEYGWLYVERGNQLKEQLCPFGPGPGVRCGGWCPHFGEPESGKWAGEPVTYLSICHGTVFKFEELSDDRAFSNPHLP